MSLQPPPPPLQPPVHTVNFSVVRGRTITTFFASQTTLSAMGNGTVPMGKMKHVRQLPSPPYDHVTTLLGANHRPTCYGVFCRLHGVKICMPYTIACNGIMECPDYADERDCSKCLHPISPVWLGRHLLQNPSPRSTLS